MTAGFRCFSSRRFERIFKTRFMQIVFYLGVLSRYVNISTPFYFTKDFFKIPLTYSSSFSRSNYKV